MARPRRTSSSTPRKGPRSQRAYSARSMSTRSTKAKPSVERPQAYVLVPHLRDVLASLEKERKEHPSKNVLSITKTMQQQTSVAHTLRQKGNNDTVNDPELLPIYFVKYKLPQAETALHHFLRTIKPGIDLSPHIDLLRKSGVGDMQALASLGQWEDADLRKALAEMYAHAGLTEVQLVALRQAIQKFAISGSVTASTLGR
ncbi:hypothetical protein MKEN_00763000 [Mycena kentingensis (nom. inval.)]|nr:hypothetical protein MKEN_00763000 [Mycena kentingensis (nom. inval.)]